MNAYFATIGFFDGVHVGHQFLLSQLKTLAEQAHTKSLVITFENHPREVLCPAKEQKMLSTFEERIQLLRQSNVDDIKILHFTKEMAQLTASQFMQDVLQPLCVKGLLLGFNNGFGSDRHLSFEELRKQGAVSGITLVKGHELDTKSQVSSTHIRQLVYNKHIEEANTLLGYAYTLQGTVVAGKQIGRTMGFPTANLSVDEHKLLPADGVYFGRVVVPDSSTEYAALVNIGVRPTVDNSGKRTIEVHLLHYSDNLYGKKIKVYLDTYWREEHTFSTINELAQQLEHDRETCENYYMKQ